MTENKVTTYTFTSDDYKLLHSILPNNLCAFCITKDSCCGCSENDSYRMATKPYRDNDIYELALELKTADDALKSILNYINRFFKSIDELKEYSKYIDKNNSTDISPCDVDISDNKDAVTANLSLDSKLFYLFLDSLGLNYSQYEMLEKIYEMLSKIKSDKK